jgi:hypothetical protein
VARLAFLWALCSSQIVQRLEGSALRLGPEDTSASPLKIDIILNPLTRAAQRLAQVGAAIRVY